jgi:hypothetical protein
VGVATRQVRISSVDLHALAANSEARSLPINTLLRGWRSSRAEAPEPRLGDPHLFGEEPELMRRVFAAGCRRYLEFGIGGSTLLALRSGAEMVVAADSDRRWVEVARTHPELAPKVANGQIRLVHADVGPTGDWGRPAADSPQTAWPNYLARPWTEWRNFGLLPDLVLVDGRFRVACCLSILLAFADQREAPRIMIHDIGPERPYYGTIFEFFETVEAVGSLHLLARRPDASTLGAVTRLLDFQYDAR